MEIDVKEWEPFIEKMVAKYPKQYQDDLKQECWLVLYSMPKDFKGKFKNYTAKKMKYACIDFFKANRLNYPSLDEPVFFDEEEVRAIDLIPDGKDLESAIIAKDWFDQIDKRLTDRKSVV